MQNIPTIRIFLSSPSDVNDERTIARQIIEDLPYRPLLRGKIGVQIIAWDKIVAGTPLRANLKPQDAINKGLPRPSECDITIVILWSRIGTPFKDKDGTPYESGTHWELLDALHQSSHDRVVIYRSKIKPTSLDDPTSAHYLNNLEQWQRLNKFLDSELFYRADEGIQRSLTDYHTLEDFRKLVERDLEEFVRELLDSVNTASPALNLATRPVLPPHEEIIEVKTELWNESPFPGLQAFTPRQAPIFFGRGRETDLLIRRVADRRFVAVVGASGSGKSSLVGELSLSLD